MPSGFFDMFGYAGGFLTVIACVPQVIKSIRTGSVRDFSLGMLVVMNVGIASWIVYGATHDDLPILIANSVTIPLWGALLVLKLKEEAPQVSDDDRS